MSVTYLRWEDVRRQMEQKRLEALVQAALDDQKQMSTILGDFRVFKRQLDTEFP